MDTTHPVDPYFAILLHRSNLFENMKLVLVMFKSQKDDSMMAEVNNCVLNTVFKILVYLLRQQGGVFDVIKLSKVVFEVMEGVRKCSKIERILPTQEIDIEMELNILSILNSCVDMKNIPIGSKLEIGYFLLNKISFLVSQIKNIFQKSSPFLTKMKMLK